jgi:hypothetical protein
MGQAQIENQTNESDSAVPYRSKTYAERQTHYVETGTLHWASVYVAREHWRRDGVQQCPCVDCVLVRKHLAEAQR